jgi:hypothetical protein
VDGLADTINKCLYINEDKSAEEADSTGDSEDDESLIKQEIIDSVKEPLQSLAGFVNGNDNVKLYTTYKVDRHEKTDANGVKHESRSTQTINDLYNSLKVTQVNDGIRLTFENDFNDDIDEYEIDMLFSDCDDVVDPLQIEKNGTIHVALCDSAKLKMVVSKDGKALSRKAVEALMYA